MAEIFFPLAEATLDFLPLKGSLSDRLPFEALGEAERESLGLFFEKAVRHGFAPEALPLRFL